MTGPAHYREAEKLIAAANRRLIGNDAEWLQTPERRAELRAEAAIHATLALAAAMADVLVGPVGADWSQISAPGTSAPRAGEKE
jgi:hypothetical protein